MVEITRGSLLTADAEALVNTVNCVGYMGKGIALQFKNKCPEMYLDYKKKCDNKEVRLGVPYLWSDAEVQILNFPTKGHWREDSNLSDIELGLKFLAENHEKLEINSIALPQLGCGNGGLKWKDVKNLINKHLGPLDLLDVYVYEDYRGEMK